LQVSLVPQLLSSRSSFSAEVTRVLGHSSVVIIERYYAKWNKAQQDILDGDLARAWKA
jgi:hypothetical protein